MREVVRFIVGRLATRTFWLLFITSLLGMLMNEMRNTFKDQIFQSAVSHMKSRGWPGWIKP